MRAYSLDLRQRIVHALQEGQSQPAVAVRFGVSLSSVQRYARLHREAGNLAAKPLPGRKPAFDAEQAQELNALLDQRADWTLRDIATAWKEQTGLAVSLSALHRTIHRLDYRYKKRPALPLNAPLKNALPSEST